MSLPKDVDLIASLLLLKREIMKVAGVKAIPTIIVTEEAVVKIARKIDPTGTIYPDPIGRAIKFAGIDIVSEKIA